MSSKLDQLRDEFRERINLIQNRIQSIKVGTNDNNNNNIEPKLTTNETYYSSRNSIPTPRKTVTQTDSTKSFDYLSKDSENKSDQSSDYYHKYGNEIKTNLNSFGKKDDFNQDLIKRSHQTINNYDKELKPKFSETYLKSKLSDSSEKLWKSTDTIGMACRYCRRRFASSERLEKHESVCMSSLDKSRIKFNSFEQRVKGQPNDYLLVHENAIKDWPKVVPKKSNWRQKHEYTVSSIKAAKGQVSDGPSASQILASIQQQCNYCKRRFNEGAIKRHLPICAKLYHKNLMKN